VIYFLAGLTVWLALSLYWAALTRRDMRMLAAQLAIVSLRIAEVAEVVELLDKDLRKMTEEESS
jgi:hypothetical protein